MRFASYCYDHRVKRPVFSRQYWLATIAAGLVLAIAPSSADEGMWTFDNPPRAQWREHYGFDPSQQWLDHLRLSSVRLTLRPTIVITGCRDSD